MTEERDWTPFPQEVHDCIESLECKELAGALCRSPRFRADVCEEMWRRRRERLTQIALWFVVFFFTAAGAVWMLR